MTRRNKNFRGRSWLWLKKDFRGTSWVGRKKDFRHRKLLGWAKYFRGRKSSKKIQDVRGNLSLTQMKGCHGARLRWRITVWSFTFLFVKNITALCSVSSVTMQVFWSIFHVLMFPVTVHSASELPWILQPKLTLNGIQLRYRSNLLATWDVDFKVYRKYKTSCETKQWASRRCECSSAMLCYQRHSRQS